MYISPFSHSRRSCPQPPTTPMSYQSGYRGQREVMKHTQLPKGGPLKTEMMIILFIQDQVEFLLPPVMRLFLTCLLLSVSGDATPPYPIHLYTLSNIPTTSHLTAFSLHISSVWSQEKNSDTFGNTTAVEETAATDPNNYTTKKDPAVSHTVHVEINGKRAESDLRVRRSQQFGYQEHVRQNRHGYACATHCTCHKTRSGCGW